MCLDAGFDNPSGRSAAAEGGYIGHIRPPGNNPPAKRRPGRRKPRRWVVERTLGWLSKCWGILVRGDNFSLRSPGSRGGSVHPRVGGENGPAGGHLLGKRRSTPA